PHGRETPPPAQAKQAQIGKRISPHPLEPPEERSNGEGEDSLLGRLLGQAREFSSHMFEQAQPSPEEQRAEQYHPGTDEEQEQPAQSAEEKPSRIAQKRPPVQQTKGQRVQAPPDTPPQDLAERYKTGLRSLNVRRIVVLLLAVPLLLASALTSSLIQIPYQDQIIPLLPLVCAAIELAALLLSYDLLADGFRRWGCNTLICVAGLLTLADGATMLWLNDREGSLPYSLVSVLALAAGLWGRYMERSCLRSACRTAASAKEPYRVTLDPCRWDGRPAYAKHPGGVQGFGSQIQSPSGPSRLFRRLSPLLLLGCVVFSLLSVFFSGQGELLLWNLSATTCACALFALALAFPLPYRLSTRRLTAGGAALAGWEGIRSRGRNSCILLGDHDLFPPGAASLNGVKIFPAFAADRVVSYTATLIRLSGCGLDRIFYEYMHSQGMAYRRAQRPAFYEGGISAVIRNDQVLVGDASFMHLMEIPLPQGLNVKNAVFCAINGELAGIFALNYALYATVRPSLFSLLSNRISPVLATRDFNITPAMLTQRFKLPGDRLIFPAQERRRDLSDQEQPHGQTLVCLLCREGIGPLAEAVVGAKRLRAAVRLNTGLAAAGSVIGLLLAFYLTSQAAFSSLSVLNLLVFQLAWLVPTLLISGWVNRY
ncbi:MAG: hypothetical protein LUF80_04080, partial [Oscillospiraceae bacterium]|nr:hypothetical protein [Oscillospiraceae bacterium]